MRGVEGWEVEACGGYFAYVRVALSSSLSPLTECVRRFVIRTMGLLRNSSRRDWQST